jgi:hypothetical protein
VEIKQIKRERKRFCRDTDGRGGGEPKGEEIKE